MVKSPSTDLNRVNRPGSFFALYIVMYDKNSILERAREFMGEEESINLRITGKRRENSE